VESVGMAPVNRRVGKDPKVGVQRVLSA
jgi:hypothetical protein